MLRTARFASTAVALCIVACSATETPPGDAAVDTAVRADSGTGMCAVDGECDDGVFCNGVERCAPADPSANAIGCVLPGSACLPGQTCDEATDRCTTSCTGSGGDADGDGVRSTSCGGMDCDDADASRYPGAREVCDAEGHDEDCDTSTFGFRDGDGDDEPDAACCNGSGADLQCGTDCDDAHPTVNPSAPEVCNGRDDDCDTSTDESVLIVFYTDADGDNFGSSDTAAPTMSACSQPPGFSALNTDCNDAVASIHPGAVDSCDAASVDEDCDGVPNDPPGGCACTAGTPSRPCLEAQGLCAAGTESCVGGSWSTCSIGPSAETCNMLDDDCNGIVDNGVTVQCYGDFDNDGFSPGGLPTASCPAPGRDAYGGCPIGSTARVPVGASIDCDDTSPRAFPNALETCNSIDDDCDASVDEGLTVACYFDADRDGYALMSAPRMNLCPVAGPSGPSCPDQYTGRVPLARASSDCTAGENDATINGGQLDACDGKDNDCDGTVDNGARLTCYTDSDLDSYAAMSAPSTSECPVNGRPPEFGGCPVGSTVRQPRMTGVDVDCNDGEVSIHPGAIELCDAIDQNCNGQTSDSVMVTCYADLDDDGYAPVSTPATMRCPDASRPGVGGCPAGYTNRAPTTGNIDCWDSGAAPPAGAQYAGCGAASITSAAVHPNATETCQYQSVSMSGTTNPATPVECDQDCSGAGASNEPRITCFVDRDGDNYGGATSYAQCAIAGAPGYGGCSDVLCGGSVCGGHHLTTRGGDCDDMDSAHSPVTPEACDAADQDCDGLIDEGLATMPRSYWADGDADGYGRGSSVTVPGCSASVAPPGYALQGGDCCDTDDYAYPGQISWFTTPRSGCGGFDYDCNGSEQRAPSTVGSACVTGCSGGMYWGCASPPNQAFLCYSGAAPACGAAGPSCTCPTSACGNSCFSSPTTCCGATVGSASATAAEPCH